MVSLNPLIGGVVLPAHLRGKESVVLEFGRHMPLPIPDLQVTDAGISGTLSFSLTCGTFAVFVPWQAVWALVTRDHKGWIWAEAMPKSVVGALVEAARSPGFHKPGTAQYHKPAQIDHVRARVADVIDLAAFRGRHTRGGVS